jgi:hypothetical protein
VCLETTLLVGANAPSYLECELGALLDEVQRVLSRVAAMQEMQEGDPRPRHRDLMM